MVRQNLKYSVQKSIQDRCCVLMSFLSSFWHLPTLENLLFHCTCQQNRRCHHFDACLFFGLFFGNFWLLLAPKLVKNTLRKPGWFSVCFWECFWTPELADNPPKGPSGGSRLAQRLSKLDHVSHLRAKLSPSHPFGHFWPPFWSYFKSFWWYI